jgi:uncharacterized protein YjbI with pentapeptide repeats
MRISLKNIGFKCINFRGADLSRTDLSGCIFEWANLSGTNLRNANLIGADLRNVDLRDADLTGANLQDSDMSEAYLKNANLTGANLTNVNLRKARIGEAKLSDSAPPGQKRLLKLLIDHARSAYRDEPNWCSENCSITNFAGNLIGNQSAGIAVIMQVIPEFNIEVLYQGDERIKVQELQRIVWREQNIERSH